MQAVYLSITTFAVAAIYCAWRTYLEIQLRRDQNLRRRVAYMLWIAANQFD